MLREAGKPREGAVKGHGIHHHHFGFIGAIVFLALFVLILWLM